MYVACVVGRVIASRKSAGLEGVPLLVVQPLDEALQPLGAPHVAADTCGVGPDERVLCVGSRDAAMALAPRVAPVDAAIVGIVDAVDVHVAGQGP